MLSSWHAPALGAHAAIRSGILPYDRFVQHLLALSFQNRQTLVKQWRSSQDVDAIVADLSKTFDPNSLVYDYYLLLFHVPKLRAALRNRSWSTDYLTTLGDTPEASAYYRFIQDYAMKVEILKPARTMMDQETLLDEADLWLLLRHFAHTQEPLKHFLLARIELFNMTQLIREYGGAKRFVSKNPLLLAQARDTTALIIGEAQFLTEMVCFPQRLAIDTAHTQTLTTADILSAELFWLKKAASLNQPDMILLHLILMLSHIKTNQELARTVENVSWPSQTVNYGN
jgi:hypothetical protein